MPKATDCQGFRDTTDLLAFAHRLPDLPVHRRCATANAPASAAHPLVRRRVVRQTSAGEQRHRPGYRACHLVGGGSLLGIMTIVLPRPTARRSVMPRLKPATPLHYLDASSLTKVMSTAVAIQSARRARQYQSRPRPPPMARLRGHGKRHQVRPLHYPYAALPAGVPPRGWSDYRGRSTPISREPVSPAGTRFNYATSLSSSWAPILDRLGQPLDTYAAQHIFQPLHARHHLPSRPCLRGPHRAGRLSKAPSCAGARSRIRSLLSQWARERAMPRVHHRADDLTSSRRLCWGRQERPAARFGRGVTTPQAARGAALAVLGWDIYSPYPLWFAPPSRPLLRHTGAPPVC